MENLVINPNFWKNKRVFLTGHTGFKGAWLSLWLQNLGANVCGYALNPPTEPSLFALADIKRGMASVEGDVRDFKKLQTTIREFKPEIVIHMAAQALVRSSYEDPVETYSTNVMGTVNLFEILRTTSSVQTILNVTSDKCYENKEISQGYSEDSPFGGHDPYSSSKGCAELVTSAFRKSFFGTKNSPSLASARAGNVIGGGDWAADRLIPDFIRAAQKNETIKIRNPLSTRPWQHVLDPIHGYMMLTENLWQKGPKFAEGWNFGPSEEESKTVGFLADRICQLWNGQIKWEKDGAPQVHEAKSLSLNCKKANDLLGWRPKLNLENSLKWTMDWYQGFETKVNLRALTEKQIKTFQDL
jgi:CDP-glucose 4,6-dehydratase